MKKIGDEIPPCLAVYKRNPWVCPGYEDLGKLRYLRVTFSMPRVVGFAGGFVTAILFPPGVSIFLFQFELLFTLPFTHAFVALLFPVSFLFLFYPQLSDTSGSTLHARSFRLPILPLTFSLRTMN